ncbi:MAG: FAD-binding oxidoreductase [Thermoplasmata archaeon]|nr:FAD-binding oxidoreductase [Thermoplasmata archaeon]
MAFETIYRHEGKLNNEIKEKIRAIVPDGFSDSLADRISYSHDYWPIALRWFLDGKLPSMPDCIVWPTNEEQIADIIKIANQEKVAIVPYGGGSGVMGGVVAIKGGVVVDLKRMDAVLEMDEESLMVRVQAGINGMNFERWLNRHGYTLGHIPQSLYPSTLGGWLACKAAGQFSTKYGKIEDIVLALKAVLADGSIIASKPVPRSSTGPEVERLLLGSEGILGIITEATLRIWPYPEERVFISFLFSSLAHALNAVRRILRRGVYPAVIRIYDENETIRHFYNFEEVKGKIILIMVLEGDKKVVELEERVAREECGKDGKELGEKPVVHWVETRFDVRDASKFVPKGFIFDTVEMSVNWKNAMQLYENVINALRGIEGIIIASAHASHFYPQGVCFYFTFGGLPPRDKNAFDFYMEAWDTMMDACIKSNASISHHHGIGITRKKWLSKEMGKRMEMLRKIKAAIDKNNIMNPGKMGDVNEED